MKLDDRHVMPILLTLLGVLILMMLLDTAMSEVSEPAPVMRVISQRELDDTVARLIGEARNEAVDRLISDARDEAGQ